MAIRPIVGSILIAFGFLFTSSGAWDIVRSLDPYLSVLIGIMLTAIGRFVWNNRKRSTKNRSRLDRLGRTVYGDDLDDTRHGITVQLDEIEETVDELEKELLD